MCSHGQQAFAARDVSGAGASRTARGTYREWAEWLGGTSRGPLTSPEEKRTWSISQMPVDVFAGVEAHVCRHAGQEDVLARLERLHGHGLSLQVADRAHLIASEQLETSEVDAGQHDNRVTCVDADDERAGERHREVGPRPPPVGVQRADLEERDAGEGVVMKPLGAIWTGIVVATAFALGLCGVGPAHGAPLVVGPGETVTLDAGTHQFDSVTISPTGRLKLLGDVTLNVAGDVRVLFGLIVDPEEGPLPSRGTIFHFPWAALPAGAFFGTDGSPGMNGVSGFYLGGVKALPTLQPATSGGPGGDGGMGGSVIGPPASLTINAQNDILIDGAIDQLGTRAGDGGSGGRGGDGGVGANTSELPPSPGSDLVVPASLRQGLAAGGSGGRGGNGGAGGAVFPVGPRITLNAGRNLILGSNSVLDVSSGAEGGHGGRGGAGGLGRPGGDAGSIKDDPALLPPGFIPIGFIGGGGDGGSGGPGENSGSGGSIFMQAQSITLAGSIAQLGADGGTGGDGGNGGVPQGGPANGPLHFGNGGKGGNGGCGGSGGNLFLRALSITDNSSRQSRAGGFGGGGGGGGQFTPFPGLPGARGCNGAPGSLVTFDMSSSPLSNGAFDEGLAFWLQAGNGQASIVLIGDNPVAQLTTTATDPITIRQLISMGVGARQQLQFDYRFQTAAGTLNVFQGGALLLSITSGAAMSAVGVATTGAGALPGFTRVSLTYTNPNRSTNDTLGFTLLPGSVAEVQIDNVSLAVAPVVPFASLTARAKIEAEDQEFEVKGTFTLGAASNGINPLTEDVSLQVGAFTVTIPAGSFRGHGHGRFEFKGIVGGAALEVKIRALGRSRFEFKAEGKGANLTGTVNPVMAGIGIGNDGGSTGVVAKLDD